MARVKSFREEMKGFPYWQVAVLALIRFSEPIAFTSPFPYIYFMVRDFGFDEDDISKYCGYLSSVFAFFQFLFCIQWGYLSDKIGRKPVLIIGLTGTTVSILIFGFSKNYWQALFSRALMGSINGNVAVIRTSLGETTNKPRHQGLALSVVPFLWQVGCIIGPLSGYLVDIDYDKNNDILSYKLLNLFTLEFPANNYLLINSHGLNFIEWLFGSDSAMKHLFKEYPYALSNVVVAICLVSSLVVTILFLEETNPRYRNKRDVGLIIGDNILRLFRMNPPRRTWSESSHESCSPMAFQRSSSANEEMEPMIQTVRSNNTELSNISYGAILPEPERDEYAEDDLRSIDSQSFNDFTVTSLNDNSRVVHAPVGLAGQNQSQNTLNRIQSRRRGLESSTSNGRHFSMSSHHNGHNLIDNLENIPPMGKLSRRASFALLSTYSLTLQTTRQSIRDEMERNEETQISWDVLLDPNVFKCIIYSFSLSLHSIIFDEFLPIFLSSDIVRDPTNGKLLSKFPFEVWGGLGWDSKTVGTLLSSTGGIGCFIVLFLYPYIDRYYSPVKALALFNVFFIPAYLLIPLCVFLQTPNFQYLNSIVDVSKVGVYLLCFIRVFGNAISNPLLVLITHKLAPQNHRAFINGSTLSISALGRFLGPTIWGYLMSKFMKMGLGEMTFWSLGFICCACAYLNMSMYTIQFDEDEDDTSFME